MTLRGRHRAARRPAGRARSCARRAAGDPRGRRRRGHRPGAGRQARLRQRGGRARCSASQPPRRCSRRRSAEIMARCELLDAGRASRSRSTRLPGPPRADAARTPSRDSSSSSTARRGEERWSRIKATPVRDADGAVRLAINVIEDITELKQRRAGPALPGRGQPRARRLARLRGDARRGRAARGPGDRRLVRRRPRRRRAASSTASRSRTSTRDKVSWAREIAERYPADPRSDRGVAPRPAHGRVRSSGRRSRTR